MHEDGSSSARSRVADSAHDDGAIDAAGADETDQAGALDVGETLDETLWRRRRGRGGRLFLVGEAKREYRGACGARLRLNRKGIASYVTYLIIRGRRSGFVLGSVVRSRRDRGVDGVPVFSLSPVRQDEKEHYRQK